MAEMRDRSSISADTQDDGSTFSVKLPESARTLFSSYPPNSVAPTTISAAENSIVAADTSVLDADEVVPTENAARSLGDSIGATTYEQAEMTILKPDDLSSLITEYGTVANLPKPPDPEDWIKAQRQVTEITFDLPNLPRDVARTNGVRGTGGLILDDHEFPWEHASEMAAAAFGGLTMSPHAATILEVSRLVGVTPSVIRDWRRHPGFARRVDNLLRGSQDEIYDAGMAIKARRVVELQKRHIALTEVIERRQEWAAEFAVDDIVVDPGSEEAYHLPGVGTGALTITIKSIGSGDNQRTVIESGFDSALFRELREIEKHLAQELGQWNATDGIKLNIKMYAGINLDAV